MTTDILSTPATADAPLLSRFPLLAASVEESGRIEARLAQLSAALAAGCVRKVDFDNLKFDLGRAADRAWDLQVAEPHFRGEREDRLSEATRKLYGSIQIMSLHDVRVHAPKMLTVKVPDSATRAMQAYFDELVPLAERLYSLKGLVLKGRAPATPAQLAARKARENPDKVVRTCPCCFRSIAVLRGAMAHHGYRRPGRAYQTPSCSGISFEPLEDSPRGTEARRAEIFATLERMHTQLRVQDTMTEVAVPRGRSREDLIPRSDARFARALRDWVRDIESDIDAEKRDLALCEKVIGAWSPAHPRAGLE